MSSLRSIQISLPSLEMYSGTDVSAYTEKLTRLGFPKQSVEHLLDSMAAHGFEKVTCIRIGNDFCENRLPDERQIRHAISLCEEEHLDLTIVTPPSTNFGLSRLEACLDYLLEASTNVRFVINDCGVYRLLSNRGISANSIIAGRLFFRYPFDPRMDSYHDLKATGLLTHTFKLLDTVAYEYDLPCQLVDNRDNNPANAEHDANGVNKRPIQGLLLPYSFITTGRICAYRALGCDLRDKFVIPRTNYCMQGCADEYSILYCESNSKTPLCFLQKGNTILYPNDLEIYNFSHLDYIAIETL